MKRIGLAHKKITALFAVLSITMVLAGCASKDSVNEAASVKDSWRTQGRYQELNVKTPNGDNRIWVKCTDNPVRLSINKDADECIEICSVSIHGDKIGNVDYLYDNILSEDIDGDGYGDIIASNYEPAGIFKNVYIWDKAGEAFVYSDKYSCYEGQDKAAAEESSKPFNEGIETSEPAASKEYTDQEIMDAIVDYYTDKYYPDGTYVIFDTENVVRGDEVDYILRYQPSDAQEEEMIASGSGPVANIYEVTVTVNKTTYRAWDEFGDKVNITPYLNPSERKASESGDNISFADIADYAFGFSSGAGGWGTDLYVDKDGRFSGSFHDSDMGDTGPGYPGGICYICDFEGRFTDLKKVDDYTYEFRVASLNCLTPASGEQIIDEVKYVYSGPYGLEDSDVMYLYLPGRSIADFTEDMMMWIYMPEGQRVLENYVINNAAHDELFVSYEPYGYDY